jgi:ABC-type multidrug transport system ATPase subunit
MQEPTSGLDSAIAYSLIKVLKTYTQQNKKTVVTTIHQPSSQIFYMFDNILLLADGQVSQVTEVPLRAVQGFLLQIAYFGKATKIMSFFNSVGLYSKLDYNPADFIRQSLYSVVLQSWISFALLFCS